MALRSRNLGGLVRALIVEDDPQVSALIRDTLIAEGYTVDCVEDGERALAQLQAVRYGLMVLDAMLPGRDGFALLESLRAAGRDVAVLILTARDGVEDRVRGLEGGADDYLVKPFHLRELRARVRALLRRSHHLEPSPMRVGRLTLDPHGRRAAWNGTEVHLSSREFALLEFLALNADGVFSRVTILERVWPGNSTTDPRTVDTYIRYLRRELGDDAIETVRGLGYRFRGEPARGKR